MNKLKCIPPFLTLSVISWSMVALVIVLYRKQIWSLPTARPRLVT